VTFMSQAGIDRGVPEQLGLASQVLPVRGCRTVAKADMVRNNGTPTITVDPDTYKVSIDGRPATIEAARTLPLAQLFYLA
jgi:urease subunit alpha